MPGGHLAARGGPSFAGDAECPTQVDHRRVRTFQLDPAAVITSVLALSELATLLSFLLLMAKLAKTGVRLRALKPSLVPPFEFQRARDLPALASCKTLDIPGRLCRRAPTIYATADADTSWPEIYICSREQEVAGCAARLHSCARSSPCPAGLFKPAEAKKKAAARAQTPAADAAAAHA